MEDFNPDLRIVLDFFIYGADQKNRSDSDNELLFELAKEYLPSLGCKFQEKNFRRSDCGCLSKQKQQKF